MSFFDTQSQAWDSANWEFSLIFEDLQDADLWRRAYPELLSIGELASHVVYSQVTFASKLEPECGLASPLVRQVSRYYLDAVKEPTTLAMSVAEVAENVDRVQRVTKEVFLRSSATRETPLSFDGPGRTFGDFADYMVFHVAYHTGQAFSVRHLMGHRTNDN